MSSIFNQPDATPLEFVNELTKLYGKIWLDWDPESFWSVIWPREKLFGKGFDKIVIAGSKSPEHQESLKEFIKNKIMAAKAVLSNDLFWKDWFTFEKCCLAFNNVIPSFDMIEHPSPAMMAYCVRVAVDLNRLPLLRKSGKERVFSSEVKSYIANQAFLEGIIYLPPPLDFAQSKMDELSGMSSTAKAIATRAESGVGQADETAEGIGAVRALIIKKYAYDNHRKPLF